MSLETLKKRVVEAIDARAGEIIDIGRRIWQNPELGYKEFKTAEIVEEKYRELGWKYEGKLAITGSKAYLGEASKSASVGIIGELDAVRCPDHPACDSITGAVHCMWS